VAVDVCVVMRREEKGTGQMINGSMANKTPPPTELQTPITVMTLTQIMNGMLRSPVPEITNYRPPRRLPLNSSAARRRHPRAIT